MIDTSTPFVFECYNNIKDGEIPTFETTDVIVYDDGAGHFDIESAIDCPYCGDTHWM